MIKLRDVENVSLRLCGIALDIRMFRQFKKLKMIMAIAKFTVSLYAKTIFGIKNKISEKTYKLNMLIWGSFRSKMKKYLVRKKIKSLL